MPKKYKVGGSCDSWCTKCKLVLEHVIIAMVGAAPKRVECNTCHSQHNYRLPKEKKATTRKTSAKRPRVTRARKWSTIVGERDTAEAKPYAISAAFEADQLLDHPMFGIGVVREALPGDKIEVLFEDGAKLLVHCRKA